MGAHPFLTFPIRGKKDAIRARHQARLVASLLHFSPLEQVCIAAGAFAVVCQALPVLRKFALCFEIDGEQLHVYARQPSIAPEEAKPVNRIKSHTAEAPALLRLAKRLPGDQAVAEADLAWLVHNAESRPAKLFDEVIKQNQEVLALLHEVYTLRGAESQNQPTQPSAA